MNPNELHNNNTMNDERIPSYPLRMPPKMRENLEATAKANGRSLNAEIVQRLDESMNRPRSVEADTYEMVLVQKLNLETSREFLQKEVDDPRTEDYLKPELKIRVKEFDRAIQKLEKLLKDIRNINVEAFRIVSDLYPD